MKSQLVIAVDFDGTIVENTWPVLGSPKFGAAYVLKWAKKQGHILILWTCRENHWLDEAKQVLIEMGLEFDYFNASSPEDIELYDNDPRKIGFDITIDDKASMICWPFQMLRIKIASIRKALKRK